MAVGLTRGAGLPAARTVLKMPYAKACCVSYRVLPWVAFA